MQYLLIQQYLYKNIENIEFVECIFMITIDGVAIIPQFTITTLEWKRTLTLTASELLDQSTYSSLAD